MIRCCRASGVHCNYFALACHARKAQCFGRRNEQVGNRKPGEPEFPVLTRTYGVTIGEAFLLIPSQWIDLQSLRTLESTCVMEQCLNWEPPFNPSGQMVGLSDSSTTDLLHVHICVVAAWNNQDVLLHSEDFSCANSRIWK